ncbi:MAG: TonB-dependent receptor [Vicinamibacterales bacterium]|nr:TonB-dependent receptor [Acidobacteriota bacterium]MDP7294714.1 TonB-dependent receptor [Vicinamibacterales bacterium]MDP7472142.1 TonB-dependent receptor [Vicinamibacterales bacterium]MDP7671790.1 TonB-dependent receptor [Vicinamibacterales bacterium]HJO38355.1 TonB-dependent receptor [Vicinamibacterales bacterium]
MRVLVVPSLALTAAFCLSASLLAAQPAGTPALSGTVSDAQGGRLTGVAITLTSERLTHFITTTSGPTGDYAFDSPPPGDYQITFALERFVAATRNVTVISSAAVRLDITLQLAPIAADAVDVVAVAPLPGGGIDARRVPANVRTFDADSLEATGVRSLGNLFDDSLGSATINESTGNPHQPDLRFRGFTASPLLGLPQGLAVYQNGVRLNEPFGDTIQFDLIPDFAVRRVQLVPGATPVFGLNALGGAVSIELANGLDSAGTRVELSGGSFGRADLTAEFGRRFGNTGLYLGASRRSENGWRDESSSEIVQVMADVVRRGQRGEVGVTGLYANSDLNGNGPVPVDLLAADRSAVYTFPDTTRNELGSVQGRANILVSSALSLQAAAYVRDIRRNTLNGDAAEFESCPADPLNALLCDDETPVIDRTTGAFIPSADGMGDAAFNRTTTDGTGYGGSVQTRLTSRWQDRENVLLLGAALDDADVDFNSTTEVGSLTPARTVDGSGILIGVAGEFPDDEFNTGLTTRNRHRALYLADTLTITPRLHATLTARYTRSTIDIDDTLGMTLDGAHTFDRLNPSVGLTAEVADGTTLYASYGESSRAPTAAELSCADPEEPCRVPNAFLSDPPLAQVVSRTVEAGARGRAAGMSIGSIDWSAAFYRSRIADDIIFVASPVLIGAGYFQNAGATERRGIELDVSGAVGRARWRASYAWTRATFQSALALPSDPDVNDAATEDGMLLVESGDHLPGVPEHGFAAGATFDLHDRWTLGADLVASSSRRLLGDEGNDQPPLPGYAIVNLLTTYRFTEQLESFLRVSNLFDADYATFGTLAEVEVPLAEAPDAGTPRFVTPGAPRGIWVGLRARF